MAEALAGEDPVKAWATDLFSGKTAHGITSLVQGADVLHVRTDANGRRTLGTVSRAKRSDGSRVGHRPVDAVVRWGGAVGARSWGTWPA